MTRIDPFCALSGSSPSLPPADSGSPERYLNSAYWPAQKRPDIEMYAIRRFGYNYQNCSDPSTWNHYCFLVDAVAAGYPVTHTPQVGDLFVARCDDTISVNGFQDSCDSDPLGNIYYVGYVEQVFSDGSFIVTEGGSDDATDSGLAFYWFSGAMDANANFIGFYPSGHSPPVAQYVSVQGPGSIQDSNGQTCGDASGAAVTCVFGEPQDVPITFTATPQPGTAFQGWGGPCSGTTTCTVTISSATPGGLGASFAAAVTTADIDISGLGSVRDSSGKTCTSASGLAGCLFIEPQGVPITFTATPHPGAAFQGWGGACSGTSTCTVTVTSGTEIDADFGAGADTGTGSTPVTTGGSGHVATTRPSDRGPSIARVRTARATIHATLRGTHLTCELARWTRHRWSRLHVGRCGTSVIYRRLVAGRYRLTVRSRKNSVTKVVVIRRGILPIRQ